MLLLLILLKVPNAYAVDSDHKTILILGDSLSAGYGIPLETAWPNLLATEIKDKGYQIVNASISGETTDGGLRALPDLLERHKPAIVIIELGANDGLRGFPIPTIRKNLTQLITLSKNSGSNVLLVGMHIPPNYGKKYTQAFHQLYHEMARLHKTALLPFLLEGVAIYPHLMQEDQLHPKSEAQPIIKGHIKEALMPLL